MEGDADLVLSGDDVVVRDDMTLLTDDDAGALPLSRVVPNAITAPEIEELLGARGDSDNTDDRRDYRLGEACVFLIEP